MSPRDLGAERRARLTQARLYLVCGGSSDASELPDLLRAAVAGGVDIVQLREKQLPDRGAGGAGERRACAVRAAGRAADRQRPPMGGAGGGRRRRPRRPGRHAGGGGPRARRPGYADRPVNAFAGADRRGRRERRGLHRRRPDPRDTHQARARGGRRGARPLRRRARPSAVLRDRRPERGQPRGGDRRGRKQGVRAARDRRARPIPSAPRASCASSSRHARWERRVDARAKRGRPARASWPRATARRSAAGRGRAPAGAADRGRRMCGAGGAVLVGGLTIHDLSRHGGSLPGAVFLAAMLALLALGMYRRRYLAVLGFRGAARVPDHRRPRWRW